MLNVTYRRIRDKKLSAQYILITIQAKIALGSTTSPSHPLFISAKGENWGGREKYIPADNDEGGNERLDIF